MHILISNDDGIFADGIRALVKEAIRAGHRVTVFAPDSQRSAASHSLSIARPLCAQSVEYEDGVQAYSVNGTPADCVRLGLFLTQDDPVDFVLSGINNGSNRGAAIVYSGTVGAAMEAALCEVPAVAVSLCGHDCSDYTEAARLGVKTMEWAVNHPLPRGEVYNLNVPGNVYGCSIRSATVSNDYMAAPMYEQTAQGYVLVDRGMPIPESSADSDLMITKAGDASLSIISWNMLSSTSMPDLVDLNREVDVHDA